MKLYHNLVKNDVSIISPINFKIDEINENFNLSLNYTNKFHEGTDTISFNESSQYHNYNTNLKNVYQKKKINKCIHNFSNYY